MRGKDRKLLLVKMTKKNTEKSHGESMNKGNN